MRKEARKGEKTESESEGENYSSVNSRATTNIGFAKVKSGGGFDRNRSKLGKAVINSKRTSLPEDSIFESSAFKLKQTRKPRDRLFLILNSIRFDSTILSLKITRKGEEPTPFALLLIHRRSLSAGCHKGARCKY